MIFLLNSVDEGSADLIVVEACCELSALAYRNNCVVVADLARDGFTITLPADENVSFWITQDSSGDRVISIEKGSSDA